MLTLCVSLLLVLAGWLGTGRRGLRASSWDGAGSLRSWLAASVCLLLAHAPLLRAIPTLVSSHASMTSDAGTHAAIAGTLARYGAPHGWVDTFNGGFPVGVHYPLPGWLVVAALIRAGVSAAAAMNGVLCLAVIAAPFGALLAARLVGMRAHAALAGALVVAMLSPHSAFVGGWEAGLWLGLISQAIAWPLVPIVAASLSPRSPRWLSPWAAAAMIAAHPQIGAATLATLAPLVLFMPEPRRRLLRALGASAAVGLAFFARGMGTLKVPFGWPPMDAWKVTGYPPDRVLVWAVDGELLDHARRTPILTIATWLAVLSLLVSCRRRPARLVLGGLVAVSVLTLLGGELARLGAVGALALGFLQPLRAISLVPFAAATCVSVAVEEISASLGRAPSPKAEVLGAAVSWVACLVGVVLALPARAAFVDQRMGIEDRARTLCFARYGVTQSTHASAWLTELTTGRLELDVGAAVDECGIGYGVSVPTAVPLSRSEGAGSHVGVSSAVFARLRPLEPGARERAEVLGVRGLLHASADTRGEDLGWKRAREEGGLALSLRQGGTGVVGTACVDRVLSGSDKALRDALYADAAGDWRYLLQATELSETDGPATERRAADPTCTSSEATVEELPREPGAYEAVVSSASAVDVIIRASAYPTWRTEIDGVETPWRKLAPGFLFVRMPAGRHRVTAETSWPRGYGVGIVVALLIVLRLGRARAPRSPQLARAVERALGSLLGRRKGS